MTSTFLRSLSRAAVALLILGAAPALAGPPDASSMPRPPGPADASKPKPDFPPFEEVMKDFEEVQTSEPPMFTLWYNRKTDSLRAQLPASMIGPKFLVATSMAGGPVATGFQIDHFLAYFDRMDKNLVLMRVDPRYVEGGNEPVADVIRRSYGGDIIVRSIPIMTMKGGDAIIDLDSVCKSDISGIGAWGMGAVNPSLSKWAKYRAFPQNVELTTDLAFMQRDGGRRTLFHYSISRIPESAAAYKPRPADNRVGYFETVRKDWTKKQNADSLFDRYINRWHLEKRDPSAELSAPKNPIVWYIEKTVPLKYRRWVKEGILEWNKAFHRCGFLDAVEVKQQEDYDRETKDLDPEDVRYNFFRWIVTGQAFAMGPSRDHPLTGQIFDADIVFDDSMVRHYLGDYQRLTGGDDSWRPYEPMVEEFFKAHPQWVFRSAIEKLLPTARLREDPDAQFRKNVMRQMYRRGRPVCECAAGMAEQLDFAGIALEAKGLGRDSDEFIGQIIKEIVMHEVGHCLGLRHNFKGSTWLPMKEVEEHRQVGEANVGSVMDYNPAIVAARGEDQGSFTTRSIGPYDFWAIEYGYRPAGAPYKNEEDMLSKIAGRVAEAGLDYATDEDTMSFISPDPYTNRYDMSRDVMAYATDQIKLTQSLMADIQEWAVKPGQSYSKLRRAVRNVLNQRARVSNYVARFVGGQVINRDQKGDPDSRTPVQVIPADKQRAAMKFVCEEVFAEDAYRFDPALLSKLAPGRAMHWDSDDFDFQAEFSVHDFVAGAQYQCLLQLMNPFTINRVHDNQIKFSDPENVYTLAEHIQGLTDAVWSELGDADRKGTDARPFINGFRRNLQRNQLEMLMNLVLTDPDGTVPADANAIARYTVGRLSKKIEKSLRGEMDVTSRAHLEDVKKRIDKALDAEYSIANWRGALPMFFWFMQNRPTAEKADEQGVYVLPHR